MTDSTRTLIARQLGKIGQAVQGAADAVAEALNDLLPQAPERDAIRIPVRDRR